jgi:hypothetical protein
MAKRIPDPSMMTSAARSAILNLFMLFLLRTRFKKIPYAGKLSIADPFVKEGKNFMLIPEFAAQEPMPLARAAP